MVSANWPENDRLEGREEGVQRLMGEAYRYQARLASRPLLTQSVTTAVCASQLLSVLDSASVLGNPCPYCSYNMDSVKRGAPGSSPRGVQ